MEIYWHGQACFEIRSLSSDSKTKTRIITDPYSNSIGLKLPLLKADLLLITHNHEDHNNASAVKDNPFIIEGPGEYEVKDVFVKGFFASHGQKDKKDLGRITVYIIEAEGIKICHLSDFSQKELLPEQLEIVGEDLAPHKIAPPSPHTLFLVITQYSILGEELRKNIPPPSELANSAQVPILSEIVQFFIKGEAFSQ